MGQVIGHSSVRSAARMNKAVVLFVEKVEQVNRFVETGITVNGIFEPVLPLTQPATRIKLSKLSNVPPFISDEFMIKELSRHGKVVSPIRKVLLGCKSPLLRHLVSHRRQLFMTLNNKDEVFDYRFRIRVDDFEYILFATSFALKCFECGEKGHLIKVCPSRSAPAEGAAATADHWADPWADPWADHSRQAAVTGGRPSPAAQRAAVADSGGVCQGSRI